MLYLKCEHAFLIFYIYLPGVHKINRKGLKVEVSFSKREKKLLEGIKKQDASAMEEVYVRYRNEFLGWSKRTYSLGEEEAIDLYQDTITLFFEKVIAGSVDELSSTIKTYLFGIAKNKMLQLHDVSSRKNRHEEGVAEHYRFLLEDEGFRGVYDKAKEVTERVFSSMGEACRELLQLFYFEKKSMSEIAQIMGHKNDGVTRTTKKRCLEKVRNEVLKPSEE